MRVVKYLREMSRRTALKLGGFAAVVLASGTAAFARTAADTTPRDPAPDAIGNGPPDFYPHMEWEFSLRIAWDGRHPSGTFMGGQRVYNVATGGEFSGPRLRGHVVPGGGDWAFLNPPSAALTGRSDSEKVFTFDARYIMQTADGVYIYVNNRGCKVVAPEKAAASTTEPRPLVRAITTPVFDTPLDSPYAFLSRNVYVAMSESRPTDTLMQVYRVTN